MALMSPLNPFPKMCADGIYRFFRTGPLPRILTDLGQI